MTKFLIFNVNNAFYYTFLTTYFAISDLRTICLADFINIVNRFLNIYVNFNEISFNDFI
jgi:hypothetical protein